MFVIVVFVRIARHACQLSALQLLDSFRLVLLIKGELHRLSGKSLGGPPGDQNNHFPPMSKQGHVPYNKQTDKTNKAEDEALQVLNPKKRGGANRTSTLSFHYKCVTQETNRVRNAGEAGDEQFFKRRCCCCVLLLSANVVVCHCCYR